MDNGDWAALAGIVGTILGTVSVWVRMWFQSKKLDHDYRMAELEKRPTGLEVMRGIVVQHTPQPAGPQHATNPQGGA